MSAYRRGEKKVFYLNFTVDGVRVSRSTGKFTKKEAKLVEAVEKKRMMVEGAYAEIGLSLILRESMVQVCGIIYWESTR